MASWKVVEEEEALRREPGMMLRVSRGPVVA